MWWGDHGRRHTPRDSAEGPGSEAPAEDLAPGINWEVDRWPQRRHGFLLSQCVLHAVLPAAALASGHANINDPLALPTRGGAQLGELTLPNCLFLGRLLRAGAGFPGTSGLAPGFVLTLSFPQDLGQGTLCRSCPPGTFSTSWGSSPCQPHSRCSPRGRLEAQAGTVTRDTLCGDCQPG